MAMCLHSLLEIIKNDRITLEGNLAVHMGKVRIDSVFPCTDFF